MKNIYFSSLITSICIFLLAYNCGSEPNSQAATKNNFHPTTAKNLGLLYYTLNPINEMQDPKSVEDFIRGNKSLLQDDSPTIRLARKLGNKLIESGLRAFNKADYDHAYGSVLDMGGNMAQAREVSESLQQGNVDTILMGKELLWIANVVPKAANGDWTKFINTGTQSRMTIRQIWPIYRQMGLEGTLNQYMKIFQPIVEEQVTFLALMLLN